MADIRYTTAILDDFNRPNENPVLPPWQTDVGAGMRIKGNQFYGTVFPTAASISYWGPLSITGTQMECWGKIGFSGAAIGDGWRFGFCRSGSDFLAYECLPHNGVGPDRWIIRRSDPGPGVFLTIAASPLGTPLPNINDLCLMQIDGSNINCYRSIDSGANWTLIVSATDNVLARTNLHPFLGMTGVDTAWNDFGGGIPSVRRMPQFYRWIDAPRGPTGAP